VEPAGVDCCCEVAAAADDVRCLSPASLSSSFVNRLHSKHPLDSVVCHARLQLTASVSRV